MAKDSYLRDHLNVHSLSSDQVFRSVQLKTFSKFSGWSFKMILVLNCIIVYFILMIKSSYRVDRALFDFLFNSFRILLLVICFFGHKDMKLTTQFCRLKGFGGARVFKFKFRGFTKALKNFAKYIIAFIFAKFKYIFGISRSPDSK